MILSRGINPAAFSFCLWDPLGGRSWVATMVGDGDVARKWKSVQRAVEVCANGYGSLYRAGRLIGSTGKGMIPCAATPVAPNRIRCGLHGVTQPSI